MELFGTTPDQLGQNSTLIHIRHVGVLMTYYNTEVTVILRVLLTHRKPYKIFLDGATGDGELFSS